MFASATAVRRPIAVLWCLGLLLASAPTGAVTQTMGGGAIPQGLSAGTAINGNEKKVGGAGDIDALATATIAQETFSPLCELTFRVVARGATFPNTFGWYEAKRNAAGVAVAPMLSEMHVFLGCSDAVGVQKTLTIPPAVHEIGFFLANDSSACVATTPDALGPTLAAQPANLFFSQRAFNTDGDGRIHLLVWQGHADPNAFYFGWEDLSYGGDNDFDDLLTYVTGVQCAGGGSRAPPTARGCAPMAFSSAETACSPV